MYYTSPAHGTARHSATHIRPLMTPTTKISLTTLSNNAVTLASCTGDSGPNIFGRSSSADRGWPVNLNLSSSVDKSGRPGVNVPAGTDVVDTFASAFGRTDEGDSSNGEMSERRFAGVSIGEARLRLGRLNDAEANELTDGRSDSNALDR